jgi:hypothetical protein
MNDEPRGKRAARLLKRWMDSDEGLACRMSPADGKYLENRLKSAFLAGFDAGLDHTDQFISALRKLLNDSAPAGEKGEGK